MYVSAAAIEPFICLDLVSILPQALKIKICARKSQEQCSSRLALHQLSRVVRYNGWKVKVELQNDTWPGRRRTPTLGRGDAEHRHLTEATPNNDTWPRLTRTTTLSRDDAEQRHLAETTPNNDTWPRRRRIMIKDRGHKPTKPLFFAGTWSQKCPLT